MYVYYLTKYLLSFSTTFSMIWWLLGLFFPKCLDKYLDTIKRLLILSSTTKLIWNRINDTFELLLFPMIRLLLGPFLSLIPLKVLPCHQRLITLWSLTKPFFHENLWNIWHFKTNVFTLILLFYVKCCKKLNYESSKCWYIYYLQPVHVSYENKC